MTTASTGARAFALAEEGGIFSMNLLVDGMHCPSCVAIIEGGLKKRPEIREARLNLTTKRLALRWVGELAHADALVDAINRMGYRAVPFDPKTRETGEQNEGKFLLRCLAVAGFASGNLMLFSVPLWSSDAVSMGDATREAFRWVQALIAIPAIAYCGRPFYYSAWRALREMHTNMDVPISVAVILATLMSVFETVTHGAHAYFDSGVMLLFFLLIGRYLESRARGKARGAAHDLLQMMDGTAMRVLENGALEAIPFSKLAEGMVLQVAAGEKFGADGEVLTGTSDIDTSLITGETLPQAIAKGSSVFAGMLNLSAPVTLRITRAGERSLLAEIVRLMETAEQGQARYVSLADKISHWYTPAVHILAAATFLGWEALTAAPWQTSLLYAATVLIITCPCALGLAVPVVQVVASGKLMRAGVLLKSGSALERLSSITHAVFDKTGTLTLGKPVLEKPGTHPMVAMQMAASLAAQSRHPLSVAVAHAYNGPLLPLTVHEIPGCGLEAMYEGKHIRLGKRSWCAPEAVGSDHALELFLSIDAGGREFTRFTFRDQLRSDAAAVIQQLTQAGIPVSLYSGDRAEVVGEVAKTLGITDFRAAMLPDEKAASLAALRAAGAKVLMVGDGLNDAPCLAAADVSMSPASAMDISQNAADIVFQGDQLAPVMQSWHIARFAQALVRQNFVLAMAYNIVAIPAAVAGYVTPLIAAIAMSGSSLVVILNALRLNLRKGV